MGREGKLAPVPVGWLEVVAEWLEPTMVATDLTGVLNFGFGVGQDSYFNEYT